ncbi:MAG: triose-phosphate isomerase [Deltaproteobacteria bacterium]|nr:MAG: triose-phosphate isomerase [Deltaproteobacteria bacterium]
MRKPLIAGNWKMHKTPEEARTFASQLLEELKDEREVEVVVAPPFVSLLPVKEVLGEGPIKLAAQNVHWEKEGAFTGEVSPLMLNEIGCDYVIVGHSERRGYFGETDEMVNRKVKALLDVGLRPILCVGETLKEREEGKTFQVVEAQVRGGLKDLEAGEGKELVVAYEPVWAIGTGRTATPHQAQEVQAFIRGILKELFGEEVARGIRILYGGSVKPENIAELMAEEDIDGALVGGASLKVDSFVRIVRYREVEG